MADLPIPFSPMMVRAILREIAKPGTGKTQTRRVIQSDASRLICRRCGCSERQWKLGLHAPSCSGVLEWTACDLPRYRVGDRLYVREAWRTLGDGAARDALPPRDLAPCALWFEADGAPPREVFAGRFRQGMHMMRWASRITLLVTEVRVQRLQGISEDDAAAEGWPTPEERAAEGAAEIRDAYPIGWYAALWDRLNRKRGFGWETNPWVAAYTFRPALGNIDALKAAA